jgi:HEPN domain-containing protein
MQASTTVSSKMLYAEAEQLLELGGHEMERAEEDVVIPMVCFNARQCVVNYFRGFLISQGITPVQPLTLDHLHKQCMRVEPLFTTVDLFSFECRHEDDDESYCLEVSKVEECLRTAQEVQRIVRTIS